MKTQGSVLGRRITIFLILFGILSGSPSAFSHPLLMPWESQVLTESSLKIEPKSGYFNTSSNLDEHGNSSPLSAANTATWTFFILNAKYRVSNQFNLFGDISVNSAVFHSIDQTDHSSIGLSDSRLGMAYRILESQEGPRFSLQFETLFPTYSNAASRNSGGAELGDGSMDFTGGAFFEIPFRIPRIGRFTLESGAGYTYRTHDFSSNSPWRLILEYSPDDSSFRLQAGFFGQISYKTDPAASDANGKSDLIADQLAGSGGSNLVAGINPAFLALHLKSGYQASPDFLFYLEANAPLSGNSIPMGISMNVGATFKFAPPPLSSNAIEPPFEKDPPLPSPSNRVDLSQYNLESRVLSYNDSLFLIKIDHGSLHTVEKGQFFDIFSDTRAIARAKVTEVHDEEAILSVVEYFHDQWIERRSIARRCLR